MQRRMSFALGLATALGVVACDRDSTTPSQFLRPSFGVCDPAKGNVCPPGGPAFRITGGGRIDPAIGKTTFGFTVDGRSGPPFKGQLETVYHGGAAPMLRIHSESIDFFTTFRDPELGGDCATFGGVARVSDGHMHRFSATACDNGEPGSSPGTGPDKYGISVDGHGDTGLTRLTGGNIQVHK